MNGVDLDTLGLSVFSNRPASSPHWQLSNDFRCKELKADSYNSIRAYSGLVALGGVIGFVKAGSVPSLVAVSPHFAGKSHVYA